MPDRRTQRSLREIKKAFLHLIKTKQLHEITGTEIANMADIGRTTFYLHYTDVYDVVSKLESEILIGLSQIFKVESNEDKTQSLIRRVEDSLSFIEKNIEVCKVLFSNNSFLNKFQKNCCETFLDEFYLKGRSEFALTEVNFVAWGIVGTYKNWIMGDLNIEKEKLKSIMLVIFSRFLDGVNINK